MLSLPKKILVIEDDIAIREMIVDALSSEGHMVMQASDGRYGIRSAVDNMPDIIVLDLAMPWMTGLEAMDELKANLMTRNIPIIILSVYLAIMTPPDWAKAAKVMRKPFLIDELIDAVKELALNPYN